MIRDVGSGDAESIAEIYNHYVTNTVVTFEEEALSSDEMARRIERVNASYPWLVFEQGGAVVGYAYANRFHSRCSYRSTAESTIYLAPSARGHGIGTRLYTELIDRMRDRGAHCALGVIALPNDGSVRLHEKLGFVQVGRLKEIGWKLGRFIDVGYWQRML
jgi:L-amino acid N-acyltransferase YncA